MRIAAGTDEETAPQLLELRRRFPRVAIVHDWLTVPGGSEKVVFELLAMFPDAELYTSVYDPGPWPPLITDRRVHSSFLNRLPGAARQYPRMLPLMSAAFRSFDLSAFDLVISSSHAFAKNVRRRPDALHVCYCHTPMRYAWDAGFMEAEQLGLTRVVLPLLLRWLRHQDLASSRRPDTFVANSDHVAARIERYYGRTAAVVHPPVDVDHFLGIERDPQDFYLAFGRVVPYKRIDLAIAACARLGRKLKVAGDGRALAGLRKGSTTGVEFLGAVSEDERDRLLRGARALLFPGEEDFGIVPVEAQAAGVPVVGYSRGGAAESVVDGTTGVLFEDQTAAGLAAAIERAEGLRFEEVRLRENALRFSRGQFRKGIVEVIDRGADARSASRP